MIHPHESKDSKFEPDHETSEQRSHDTAIRNDESGNDTMIRTRVDDLESTLRWANFPIHYLRPRSLQQRISFSIPTALSYI